MLHAQSAWQKQFPCTTCSSAKHYAPAEKLFHMFRAPLLAAFRIAKILKSLQLLGDNLTLFLHQLSSEYIRGHLFRTLARFLV